MSNARGRRPLFGDPAAPSTSGSGGALANVDPESLERENDRSVDQLSEKTSLLKNLTRGIHEEVETHNRMLERLGENMTTTRGMLSGTVDRFKKVMASPEKRRTLYYSLALVAVFFIIWVALTHKNSKGVPGRR